MKTMMRKCAWTVVIAGSFALAGCGNGGNGGSGPTSSAAGADVATVNGETISRDQLHSYLETTVGERALGEMIANRLILQEAKKSNITVTEKDIDDIVAQRRAEGGQSAATADEVIKTGGKQLQAYRDAIKNQLTIDRLVTKDVKVDSKALDAWFAKNKATYSVPTRVKMGVLLTSSKPRADVMVSQLKAKSKTFSQLVEEQKKAKDAMALQSSEETPLSPIETLGPIRPQVEKLKVNETTGALLLSPPNSPQKLYGVLRLIAREAGTSPKLADVKAQAETDYKMEQVARKIVAQNPQNPKFDETIQRTMGALFQENAQRGNMQMPTRRDVLRYINQTAINQLTTKLQTEAKVSVTEPTFAALAKAYTPVATPAAPGTTPGTAPAPGGAANGATNSAAPAAPKAP